MAPLLDMICLAVCFSLSIVKVLSHSLLACKDSAEKFAVSKLVHFYVFFASFSIAALKVLFCL